MIKLPKKLKVRVNKTNIVRGNQGATSSCAIQKAVQRAIQAKRRGMTVRVGSGDSIGVYDSNGFYKNANYVGSTERQQRRIDKFIDSFDDEKAKVKPCTFFLTLEEKEW